MCGSHSKQKLVVLPPPCADLDNLHQAVNDWWEKEALSSQSAAFPMSLPKFLLSSGHGLSLPGGSVGSYCTPLQDCNPSILHLWRPFGPNF